MICEKCKEQGLKSTVTPHAGSVTLMYCAPFYDEAGTYHHHDYNVQTMTYVCSNGHQWSGKQHSKCPACSWPD